MLVEIKERKLYSTEDIFEINFYSHGELLIRRERRGVNLFYKLLENSESAVRYPDIERVYIHPPSEHQKSIEMVGVIDRILAEDGKSDDFDTRVDACKHVYDLVKQKFYRDFELAQDLKPVGFPDADVWGIIPVSLYH